MNYFQEIIICRNFDVIQLSFSSLEYKARHEPLYRQKTFENGRESFEIGEIGRVNGKL